MQLLPSKHFTALCGFLLTFLVMVSFQSFSQQSIDLNKLDSYKPNTGTWQEASSVSADLYQANSLKAEKGNGILVNLPTKKNKGQDLVSIQEFGNIDLELEVMVAAGSNSGIYLMGQYEVQILDSWTKKHVQAGDMGGIYERWDESKPEGKKGYEGYAPRQNVSRAPGVWQNLKVSFQTPKFDAQGNKTRNAKFLSVVLNGVVIHENLEVFGPTRGSLFPHEIEKGPLRLQGDHGAVAFRNIKIATFDSPIPTLGRLSYETFQGSFSVDPDFDTLKSFDSGDLKMLDAPINKPKGAHLTRYRGEIDIVQPGEYIFNLFVPNGRANLTVDGKKIISATQWGQRAKINLKTGKVPFEIHAFKYEEWSETTMDFGISGAGLRYLAFSESGAELYGTVDPILVKPEDQPFLRSFMTLPDGKTISHAISVSSSQQLYYTFDLETGNIVQAWRGEFLDATPMWHDRGNGKARPIGALVDLGPDENRFISMASDLKNEGYKSRGFQVESGSIEYHYRTMGVEFSDHIRSRQDGKGLDRVVKTANSATGMQLSVAIGKEIQMIKEGLYWVVDRGYYIQVDPKSALKPTLRDHVMGKELLLAFNPEVSYSIIF